MSKFVRPSKVRHVYAEVAKPEFHYSGFKLSSATGDHQYIKANSKYMAVPIYQGGSLAIFDMDMQQRRMSPGVLPVLDGHSGPVLDFDFSPHYSQLIATGGDDCVAMVWGIPKEGLKESITEPLAALEGHQKKVSCVLYHPTASHVLATGSADKCVKIWDVEQEEEKNNFEHSEFLYGLAWSTHGELLATTARDKKLRVIDARTADGIAHCVDAHDGMKTSKVTFASGYPMAGGESIITTGSTRQSKRQFKLWDMRKMGAGAYCSMNIDQGSGAMLPFWDESRHLLYLAGKGDSSVKFFELVNESPWAFLCSEAKSNVPARGWCMVPPRCYDTSKKEVARMLKLIQKNGVGIVEPMSFICPRKSAMFQKDLYPDVASGQASKTASDYFDSDTSKPFKATLKMTTMDPKKKGDVKESSDEPKSKKATYKELENRVKKLEKLLKDDNIKFD